MTTPWALVGRRIGRCPLFLSHLQLVFCFVFGQIERCSSEALRIVLTSAQFVICTLIYRSFAVRRGPGHPLCLCVRLWDPRKVFILFRAHLFSAQPGVCLTQMCVFSGWRGGPHWSCWLAPDKCTNLVLRAWPSRVNIYTMCGWVLFSFTFLPLPHWPLPPVAILSFFFPTLLAFEFDCLPLFAWNKMPWLMAWLQRHFPILFGLAWFGSLFRFFGEVSRCPSSISFVCALHNFCRNFFNAKLDSLSLLLLLYRKIDIWRA